MRDDKFTRSLRILRCARYESFCQEISLVLRLLVPISRFFTKRYKRGISFPLLFFPFALMSLSREFGVNVIKNRAFGDPFAWTARYAQSIRRRCIPVSSHRPAHPRRRGIHNSKRLLNSSGLIGRDLRICRRVRTHVEPVCVPACNVTRCLLRVYRG